jgi:hypothetical protein
VKDDDDDDDKPESEAPGYVNVTQALEQSGFTAVQLRALVTAGIIKTTKLRGALMYCVADLNRFEGMPRVDEPEEAPPWVAEFNAVTAGYRSLVDASLKLVKQAQDHEKAMVTAFSKPLENLGDSSKALVAAVLGQNEQLVKRAADGDAARLDFVKAAETMLRDQRAELREQSELDRKHEMRREVWEGVKKAAPHMLEGLKATTGSKRLEAAAKLKEKLDPAKVAALIRYELIGSEEIDLLCTALELDRSSIEALNKAVDEAETAPAEAAPEAAE